MARFLAEILTNLVLSKVASRAAVFLLRCITRFVYFFLNIRVFLSRRLCLAQLVLVDVHLSCVVAPRY